MALFPRSCPSYGSTALRIRKRAWPLGRFLRPGFSAFGLSRWFWGTLCGYNKVSTSFRPPKPAVARIRPVVARHRRDAEKAEVTLGGGVAPKQLPMCLLFTIKRPSRFRPPSTTKRRALAPASFAASLRPQGLDMIVLLGRRKKAGPCTGKVERRQFCNTNNPAESRRQPSWFSRDGNHARLLQPLPLRHGQPLEFVIVDNADHDRCEDEVRMMHEQIIPQLPRLPGFDQAVHQVDQQDLQGDNKQAEAFRLTQGQRFFTSPHIRTERAACEVPC